MEGGQLLLRGGAPPAGLYTLLGEALLSLVLILQAFPTPCNGKAQGVKKTEHCCLLSEQSRLIGAAAPAGLVPVYSSEQLRALEHRPWCSPGSARSLGTVLVLDTLCMGMPVPLELSKELRRGKARACLCSF